MSLRKLMENTRDRLRGSIRDQARYKDEEEAGSSHSDSAERPQSPERPVHLWWKTVRASLTGRQWTALAALGVVLLWTGGSVAFAYLYNYEPFRYFKNPDDIPDLPSTCNTNQTCLFALGGAIASYNSFLPAVEAFNGTAWGSEARLPARCPGFQRDKVSPDCGDEGTYDQGVTTHSLVFNDRIYVLGHNRYGAMYSYSGNKETIKDQLGKVIKESYWREEPMLNKRREGFAVALYRNRIYAIGGRTTCTVQSKIENPDSRCTEDGHLTRTDQATQDRSVTVESIDPSKESAWRVDCAGEGEEGDENLCTKQERSGACAAVHEDKIFLIGGTDGSVVEYFDGTTWEELEVQFPSVIHGAAAISFGGKLWVIGGSSFNKHQASVISWDGSIWFRGETLTYARKYPAVVVWEYCAKEDETDSATPGIILEGQHTGVKCRDAVFVLGGSNGTTSIPEVEVATFGLQNWVVLPQLLPTKRNRLGAAVFRKAVPLTTGSSD